MTAAPTRAGTLVLLPGLLCDDAVWAPQVRALSGRVDCRVMAWGRLDSLEAMAAHVLAAVEAPRFALAGHSMGGRVALEVMRRAPGRVERLALLDTGFEAREPGEAGAREQAGREALLAQARAEGMRAMGERWARGMVHPDRLDGPLFQDILAMIERSDAGQFAAQIRALLARPDAAPVLARIDCPTLLLCGRQDAWSPLARHERMQALIASAELRVIEDAGHMTTMEAPQAVCEALAGWLAPGGG